MGGMAEYPPDNAFWGRYTQPPGGAPEAPRGGGGGAATPPHLTRDRRSESLENKSTTRYGADTPPNRKKGGPHVHNPIHAKKTHEVGRPPRRGGAHPRGLRGGNTSPPAPGAKMGPRPAASSHATRPSPPKDFWGGDGEILSRVGGQLEIQTKIWEIIFDSLGVCMKPVF